MSNAAILQLAACTPNFLIHEIMITDGTFRQNVTNEKVYYQDGFILVPDKPGLASRSTRNTSRHAPTCPATCATTPAL